MIALCEVHVMLSYLINPPIKYISKTVESTSDIIH